MVWLTESGQPPVPGSRTIAGYALKWGVVSSVRADFDEVFCTPGSVAWPSAMPICVEHDKQDVIGRLGENARLADDGMGLWLEIEPSDYHFVAGVRTGRFRGLSISFRAVAERWSVVDGRRLRSVDSARLLEVSLCDQGAHHTSVGLGSKLDIWTDNRRVGG
ncbi:MAG: hypothetical protein EON59_12075 [Alphaproteobacteria bacterium]|nr:MAG: hypothetical protein EON59_12075 [Alphaproteobacteria bacterium]